jgi:hypothetical protein
MLKRNLAGLFLILLGVVLTWGCAAKTSHTQTGPRQDVLYACNCGDSCKCMSVNTKAGNCACGKEMKWHHVVKVEGDEALLCSCKEGCACQIDPKDATKCSCGQPLKRVSLKGTGINFCNCGGSCFCNTASDQPGKCRCGMELKTVQ